MPRSSAATIAATRLSPAYLLILGDRDGLLWVLQNRRMAFTESRAAEVADLRAGDRLFLYTSRGCYHNPTRDRGRVIGEAEAKEAPTRLAKPISIGGRVFSYACDIELRSLAPFREGVVLADLVRRLEVFPDQRSWSARMRRPLLALSARDARLIAKEVAPIARPVGEAIDGYREWLQRVAARRRRSAAN
jgi:hypothetical protein